MTDQPRWPAGTPVAPSGRGPGGGRFRDVGRPGTGGWVQVLSDRLSRGWANDERGLAELAALAQQYSDADPDVPPGWEYEELLGGETAHTTRYDLPDGRSVIRKQFHFEEMDPSDFDDEDQDLEPPGHARAEYVASRVAAVIGALVPPVVQSPYDPGTIWMGYIDGAAGVSWGPWGGKDFATLDTYEGAGADAWRLGLLDLLIANSDRHAENWRFTPEAGEKRIFGIDHGEAEALTWGGLMPPERLTLAGDPDDGHSVFAALYLQGPEGPLLGSPPTPSPNPLHPDDIVELQIRLGMLADDGVLREHEWLYMQRVLALLSPYAQGTRRLIP